MYNKLPSLSSSKSKSKVFLTDLKNEETGSLGTSSSDPTVMPSIWGPETHVRINVHKSLSIFKYELRFNWRSTNQKF